MLGRVQPGERLFAILQHVLRKRQDAGYAVQPIAGTMTQARAPRDYTLDGLGADIEQGRDLLEGEPRITLETHQRFSRKAAPDLAIEVKRTRRPEQPRGTEQGKRC